MAKIRYGSGGNRVKPLIHALTILIAVGLLWAIGYDYIIQKDIGLEDIKKDSKTWENLRWGYSIIMVFVGIGVASIAIRAIYY